MRYQLGVLVAVSALVAAAIACGGTAPASDVSSVPPGTEGAAAPDSIGATQVPPPTRTPPPPTPTRDPNLISAGTYLVGDEIQPGLYRGVAGQGFGGSCYWARLKDLSGGLESILANDNAEGQFYVQVADSDKALEVACDIAYLPEMPAPVATFPDQLEAGMYLVGIDVQPGLYRGNAGQGFGDSCYWARLKDLSGGLDSLSANDNAIGQFYLEALESDEALETACELTFLATLPSPPDSFPETIQPGMYLVGVDVQPGMYKGQAGADFSQSCYWQRISNLTGDLFSIIANDNATGQFYVQVASTDMALETACELTRTGD
jgi:hypothetical protein